MVNFPHASINIVWNVPVGTEANMTFENDARIGAFLKFIDWRARLSNRRYA